MAIVLILIIIVIIIERYVNRSDTKAVKDLEKSNGGKDNFFSQDNMIQRQMTVRSNTLKQIKTMKTSDLDMQDNSAQEFL